MRVSAFSFSGKHSMDIDTNHFHSGTSRILIRNILQNIPYRTMKIITQFANQIRIYSLKIISAITVEVRAWYI